MRLRPFEDADVMVLDRLYLVKINGEIFVATIVERRGVLYFTDQDHYWLIQEAEKYAIVEEPPASKEGRPLACNKLQVLMAGICEYHRDDPTAPSVVLSLLPNGKYYAAIHRFTGQCRCKAIGGSLEAAIEEVGREFMVSIGRGPALDALRRQAKEVR